jgi:diaminopropionate ammonia-lyase
MTTMDNQQARVLFNHAIPMLSTPAPRDPHAFHRRLPGYTPTPLADAPQLAARLGVAKVWVKNEARRLGLPAYKILGASWATYRALEQHAQAVLEHGLEEWTTLEELRARLAPLQPLTLICATDGNHGRAVAHMARLLGLRAHVLVPHDMTWARQQAIHAEGAQVTLVPGTYDDAVRQAAGLANARCLVISDTAWNGYEDVPRWVMDGYATIYAEVDEELNRRGERGPDLVAAQIGVGALAASVVQHYRPQGVQVIGVEPTGAACVFASLAAGHPVSLGGELHTIMAGLNCGTPSPLAWPLLQKGLSAVVAIPDTRAEDAMRALADTGIEAGESGAAGLGGMLELLTGFQAQEYRTRLGVTGATRVLVINTEGATDADAYARIVHGARS